MREFKPLGKGKKYDYIVKGMQGSRFYGHNNALPVLNKLALLGKKLWWRAKGFLEDALPIIILGIFIVNILYALGIFNIIVNLTAPVITGLLGLPKEAVIAIAVGFLRKDVAVGMLAPLSLTVNQLVIACVVLSMFFPCIATFTIMIKELGYRSMLKATGIMLVASFMVGTVLNIIL